ncbi:MAG: hypothetical protein DMG97_16490 [Acidobacteria bacterium]|nr:MAG: hypothetical protein DMG97_16490 [Acidobacteriota bacterium]
MNQPAGISFAVNVNLRAEEWVVNSQKMVQKEDSPRTPAFLRRDWRWSEISDWRGFCVIFQWRARAPAPHECKTAD